MFGKEKADSFAIDFLNSYELGGVGFEPTTLYLKGGVFPLTNR